jgi:DNA-binding LacI/PurR family transcriptional regulator
MGREAARRLLLRLDRPDADPATLVIPAQLVDRGTGGRGPER